MSVRSARRFDLHSDHVKHVNLSRCVIRLHRILRPFTIYDIPPPLDRRYSSMNRFSLPGILLFLPSLIFAQGFSPEEAVKRMQVPEGFKVKLVACEPMIRQPLSIDFDERGRMWVLQYLQYPNPAGLKPIKQDQYLRTIWDRVPEPPPKGPKGVDRITICFDPDANGRYRKSKDFVSDLNLASGFCIGQGGVFVVQPPYLLFYADKDQNDVPDGDPEVCLSGFGMEDSHSYANSLQWGPDGWLYGAHGSTVSAKIKNPARPAEPAIEFQQGIWRYHPKTKQFELFSEGGGNTYGLDFDKYGRAIAGTNWGGKAMLHQVQGGYYIKGFAKHGPLHNAHTYGYFDHVPYENFKGGHVTCGGIIYQADVYPAEYRDQYIAGNLLSNAVYWHKMTPQGSSFTARHGGDFLVANDTWFRPVDCFLGPDGCVHVADWYDKRAAHLDPIDTWDKTNGRIYKVEYKDAKPLETFDLGKKTGLELVELLKHPNKWFRNEARRLLAEKPSLVDHATLEALRTMFQNEKELPALEAFWAIYVTGNLNESLILKGLAHPNEHVRAWTVRVLGDERTRSTEFCNALIELAKHEPSSTVRSQLACTAKRLAGDTAISIAYELLYHSEDLTDPHIPLLIWWAIEDKVLADQEFLLAKILDSDAKIRGFWKIPLVRDVLLERLARRFIAENNDQGYRGAALLLQNVPDAETASIVIRGMSKGLEGRRLPNIPATLAKPLGQRAGEQKNNAEFERLALRLGDESIYRQVLSQAADPALADAERIKKIESVAEAHRPDALPMLIDLFHNAKKEALRLAALNALQGYADEKTADAILALFPKLTGNLRQKAQAILLSRQSSALNFLLLVDKGIVTAKEVPIDQLRPVLQFNDPRIATIVEKHWGKIGAATAGEKQARISWLNIALSRGSGDPLKGKLLFTKNCAVCHLLHGEGGKVGPDLTSADRKNRGYMLTNIVDPSGYIRPEFVSYNVLLHDGRKLSGLVAESTAESITLVNVVNDQVQKTPIARNNIDELSASPTSLMPEKLLDTLNDDDVRDLFAYLQSDPIAKPKDMPPARKIEVNKKLKVLLISGSLEYKSDESLAKFQEYLEANYDVACSRAFRKSDDDLPGLEALETCDVALFFTRRLTIKGEQLERIKKYALSGKPIVGVRTASHGFQNWLEMDKEVFGGNYKNHFGAGPRCEVLIVPKAKDHPILKGVKSFGSNASLYKNPDLSKDVTPLLTATSGQNTEYVAWSREFKGGRVFYTSLGHPDDFKDPNFLQLLVNALHWTAKKDVPVK